VLQARSRQPAFRKPFLDPAVKKISQIPAVRENVYLSCNACQVFESLFLILQFKKNAQIPAVRENVYLSCNAKSMPSFSRTRMATFLINHRLWVLNSVKISLLKLMEIMFSEIKSKL
jgi:hypothetical protein